MRRILLLSPFLALSACRDAPEQAPPPPVATTTPLTVSGPDSILGVMRLEQQQTTDGSGNLPGPLQLRAAPSDSADVLVTVTRWQDVLAAEVGYEEPGLLVWRIADPWYLVATRDTVRGWIRLPDSASVITMAELLPERLSYLTAEWDGKVMQGPGAGAAIPVPGFTRDEGGEVPANVLQSLMIGQRLWLRVAVLGQSPCESAADPPVLMTGWVPAWTGGKPTVWYYSRGC